MMMLKSLVAAFLCFLLGAKVTFSISIRGCDIRDFGAVASLQQPDVSVANTNAAALIAAFQSANDGLCGTTASRTVYVPKTLPFYFTSVYLSDMKDINIQLDGTLIAHSRISSWPREECGTDDCHALDEINLTRFMNLSITGSGKIDGQGYDWWWYSISCALPMSNHSDTRADMLAIIESENILIDGITFLNSPKYHVNLKDCHNVTVRNFVIEVDVFRQKKYLSEAGFMDRYGIPTFPLNTDGIDPSASSVHIYNGSITNFDDAVAFKPCRSNDKHCRSGCSSGLVEDLQVTYSVGMTIGSVPPNANVNCVKDVTFRNINMKQPLKGIYIKSNPGNSGTGWIQNITYSNVNMTEALWWSIWMGPQQMNQPDGTFMGCDMRYPFRSTVCPTNPLVTMRDITFDHVTATGGLNPYPGVILCNDTNPCQNIVFNNVNIQQGINGVDKTLPFIVENVYGEVSDCSPTPDFKA